MHQAETRQVVFHSGASVTLLGHLTPDVMNIFLSEAADLLGQWDEACFSFENGSDSREALLWISRTIHSLRRACRGVGMEEFSQTLNAIDEYVRLVLRLAGRPGADVAAILMMSHSVLSRWVVGLRMDPHYKHDPTELNDSIRQHKAQVYQILEDEKRLSEAKILSTEPDQTLIIGQDEESQERLNEFKKGLETSNWSVFDDGDLRINQLISLVAKISAQQFILEHKYKSAPESSQDLKQMIAFNANLISDLIDSSVGLRLTPVVDMLEKLGLFAIESAQSKGCSIQFDYDGQMSQIDKKMISSLWDPLSRIVRWIIENSFESPEERVKSGKLPMGNLRVILSANGSTYKLTLEDDGRGQGDGDSSHHGQLLRNFIDSARDMLRLISVAMNVHAVPGKLTRIELIGPVSPWLNEVNVVLCGGHEFAIANHQIEELIEPGTFSTHLLRGDKQLIEFNGRLYPFVTLVELLEGAPTVKRRVQATVAIERGHVVLVRYGRDTLAVGVDAVLLQGKVIVMPLQKHLQQIRGVSGTLISGRGQPVLMVDLHELTHALIGLRREREAA